MAGWVAVVVLCVVAGGAVGTRTNDGHDFGPGESGQAGAAMSGLDFGQRPTERVLIQARDGELDRAEVRALAEDLTARYATVEGVEKVGTPVPAGDGRSALVEITLASDEPGSDDAADGVIEPMLQATEQVRAAHPDLVIGQTGSASIQHQFDAQLGDDFRQAELFSIPLTLVILIVAFGALLAAAVPVVLALSAVAGAMGLSAFASHLFPATDELASVILLVGLAVGVDYSLFYLRREREERERGVPARRAIEIAAATSGRAVVVSGMAVLIAMSGMFLAGDSTFSSLGVGTILVVTVAVAGSVTVLPAVLSLLGDKVDRPRVPLLHRLHRPGRDSRLWSAVLGPVLRRPGVALCLGVVALGALAVPMLGMTTRFTTVDDLPREVAAVATYDRLSTAFPSEGAAHLVVVAAEDGRPLDRQALAESAGELGSAANASGLFAIDDRPEITYSTDRTVARVELPFPYQETDARATESLLLLRADLVPSTVGALAGTWAGVTGFTAADHDFTEAMGDRLPLIIAFVLALTFVVLVMAFRSLVVAATSIALNLLSVAAAYGLLVLVFQHTWSEGLLDFESSGAIVTWLPLFLFVILFGLSMDYHVFVVSRVREGHELGMSTHDAVRYGIISSAPTVTSAALVMVGVFGVFGTLSLLEFKQMSVGLGAAILLDATVVRGVLVPAAMTLLGRHNWYLPSWLEWLPNLGHRAGPVGPARPVETAGVTAGPSTGEAKPGPHQPAEVFTP